MSELPKIIIENGFDFHLDEESSMIVRILPCCHFCTF